MGNVKRKGIGMRDLTRDARSNQGFGSAFDSITGFVTSGPTPNDKRVYGSLPRNPRPTFVPRYTQDYDGDCTMGE